MAGTTLYLPMNTLQNGYSLWQKRDALLIHSLFIFSGMDSADISVLSLLILFVNADGQHTNFTARHDYSIHDCSQLLPCGPLQMLKMQGKVECAMQALRIGVDMFMYETGNKSCLLCLQRSPSDGITVVPGSQLVYVKGMWDMPNISNVITTLVVFRHGLNTHRFAYGIF